MNAALKKNKTVEHVAWARVDLGSTGLGIGYLILTDQRLLLLDDFLYTERQSGLHPPTYVLMSIDRTDIRAAEETRDAEGRTRLAVEAETCISVDLAGDDHTS